jgi:hypothetical protein
MTGEPKWHVPYVTLASMLIKAVRQTRCGIGFASGADPGPWQLGPRAGMRWRCSGLTMYHSRTMEDIIAIITEYGPGRGEFLDPPLLCISNLVGKNRRLQKLRTSR